MDYYIITGVSRGIGEAIAKRLLIHGNTLFCASRTMNEDLVETASSMHVPIFYYETDLSVHGSAEDFLHEVFSRIDAERVNRIALINNAGMLDPISLIENIHPEQMERHLTLNLLTPAVLISGFISRTREMDIPKSVLNISSGASSYPYSGWSLYCSSKAGLDMITRTVGLEQKSARFPCKIVSVAPGIVDTAMQTLIRKTDRAHFAEKEFFVRLHEEGKLKEPDVVASTLVATLFSSSVATGSVLSIDELQKYVDQP